MPLPAIVSWVRQYFDSVDELPLLLSQFRFYGISEIGFDYGRVSGQLFLMGRCGDYGHSTLNVNTLFYEKAVVPRAHRFYVAALKKI